MQVPAGLQAQRDADGERIRLQEVQNAKSIIAAGGPDAVEAQKSLDALNRTGAMSASRQPTNLNSSSVSPAANDSGPLAGAIAALAPVTASRAAPAIQPTTTAPAPVVAQPAQPDQTGAVTSLGNPQFRMIPRPTSPDKSDRYDVFQVPYELGGVVTDALAPHVPGPVAAGAGTLVNVAASLIGPGGAAKPAVKGAAGAAREAFGSVGAAVADPATLARASIERATPELKQAVEKELKKKGGVNQTVLDRHVEADSLPVPMRLTEGQATQDVGKLSREQNARGTSEPLRQRFNEQNGQLIENTNAIREGAAPDIYVSSRPELGEIVIDAYRAKDAALSAQISAKYKALEEVNGGQFPLDVKQFSDNATQALHQKLLFEHVPSEIKNTIARLQKNGMNFEQFEALRTNLARIQRSPTADGNAKAAAGVIRDALEELPMPAHTVGSSLEGSATVGSGLKELADTARAAARERFSLIESDPAYKAVTSGKASADHFIEKFVVGNSTAADLKNLQTLKANIAHDPVAQQALAAGAVDYLKRAAGVVDEVGNFSQAGYNRALENIRPKLNVLFSPEQAKQIETLGRVARYTQAQPRGSFVNNSNTAVTMMVEGAKTALEKAANVGGVPIGSMIRRTAANRAADKSVKESLQTGAGVRLKDIK